MTMLLRPLPHGSGGGTRKVIPVAASTSPQRLASPSPSSSRSRFFALLLGPYALALTVFTLWERSAFPVGSRGFIGGAPTRMMEFWTIGAEAGGADAEFRNPSLTHGPLSVLAISPARTSSTVAFNLARILLERVDPTAASGWEGDLVGLQNLELKGKWDAKVLQNALGPAHAGNLSVVVKSHNPSQEYLEAQPAPFDFVLTSYRDPYDAICSEARKFHPYLFDDPEAAHLVCARRAAAEEGIQALAVRAERGSLHVDASLLWSREGLLAVAEELVAQWGVTPGTRGPVDLESVVADVLRLAPPPPGVFTVHAARTLLHPSHNTGSGSAKGKASCKELVATLARDPACQGLHALYERLFGGERKMYRGEDLAVLLQQQLQHDDQEGEEEEE